MSITKVGADVTELPGARVGGFKVVVAEHGLVRDYVCIMAGERDLKYAARKDIHDALRYCAEQAKTGWWPKVDAICIHCAPGELAALRAEFERAK